VSFLSKTTRLIDSRIFSSTGLSDEWTIGSNTAQGILDEIESDDGGVYTSALMLEIPLMSLGGIKKGDIATRSLDNVSYKVLHVYQPFDNTVQIQLGDPNA